MPHPRERKRAVALPALFVASMISAHAHLASSAQEPPGEPTIEPIEIGLTERTERTLLLIDVEAVDKQGRPLPGLKKEDFQIRVNYLWRKIYSVDDLCACGDAASDPANPPADPAEAARLALVRAPPHFILYFDFSQLGERGRRQAVEEATRWVAEVMHPEDRVMVAAYATDAGLHRLTEFTSDRDAVLRAIEEGAKMPQMRDPFPSRLGDRRGMCADGTLNCSHTGRQEYLHGRRSMGTLRNFLTDLDQVPARKTLVLFHQNAAMFPGRMYGGAPTFGAESIIDEIRRPRELYPKRRRRPSRMGWVPDLIELEEELGGAATASRTVVYPLLCGSTETWNVNFGANLADQTGGEYNRQVSDLRGLLEGAGRRCPCIYRIGLELPRKEKSFVLRTKVKVNGMTLPSRYRVEHLTQGDRWMRKAQLVLANPDMWSDLEVRAALIPARANGKTWDVSVQVAVDISSLERSPTGEHDGEWEVAALVGREEFRKTWELLGVYRARPGETVRASGVVLHEQVIKGLRPGRYELRTFARDRDTNRFGGARFSIDLPSPEEPGATVPVVLRPEGWHYRSTLPMRDDRRPPAAEATPRRIGRLPLGDPAIVRAGEPLQFLAWHCEETAAAIRAAVRRDGGERWVFSPEEQERSGNCARVSSIVDTDRLPAGGYVYELGSGERTLAATPFEILEPVTP